MGAPGWTYVIADYSHTAADAHPRVEARRLSIRRRADVGRCCTPVRSARAMCCLWVMNTTTHVSGVWRSLPLLRWPGQISGPESWPASASGLTRSGGCSWDVQARPAAGADLPFALRPDPRLFGHGVDGVCELAEQGAELLCPSG